MEFFSAKWIEHYKKMWNENRELVEGLSGFSALIEYGWVDGEKPSAFLRVDNGRAVAASHGVAPSKPDFVMKATPEIWSAICDGSLSGRAALLTRKLKFQGSMITAMKYMGAFEKSIQLLGKV
ncbi:MAG: sterol-binding protein [Gallionellales bacterium CG_4_9_14_0_8_um_filter_59_50]|nr:MAG: sterol-binding protein [Gallionellales bacterium CG_4_9_14_0_8_um_filter_59_50]